MRRLSEIPHRLAQIAEVLHFYCSVAAEVVFGPLQLFSSVALLCHPAQRQFLVRTHLVAVSDGRGSDLVFRTTSSPF